MSVSNDSGHFFQTNDSLEKQNRRALKRSKLSLAGNPITCPTKVLALLADPTSSHHVYITEAGNVARRVDLNKTKCATEVFRGHTAPVVCIALNDDASVLFTGSWDKRLLSYSTSTRQVLTTFTSHTDFIKSVIYTSHLPSRPLLISASADSTIILWNPDTGARYQVLKGHIRGVQSLCIDLFSLTSTQFTLYSGGSNREIKRWTITATSGKEDMEGGEIIQHETGINAIKFLGDDGDMYTASADGSAKRFERDELSKEGAKMSADTILKHPDFVNDVVMSSDGRWIVTACSDEEIRVWDAGSGSLYHTFTGHYDVVNSLLVIGSKLISGSLDATVRQWSLTIGDLKIALEEAEKQKSNDPVEEVVEVKKVESKSGMTEEEERELAELMDESD